MTDGEIPPQTFPNYEPIDPNGPKIATPKQAKPLFKLINRMLRPRPKVRVSRMKKGVAKHKRDEAAYL